MPASGSFAIDTNVAIALMAGDRTIRQQVAEADEIFLSIVVLGELYFGASRSGRLEHNLRQIETLAANCQIAELGVETARNYGAIKTALRRNGTPIPDNDIWIAASALQMDLAVATRDAHFDVVENLSIARW